MEMTADEIMAMLDEAEAYMGQTKASLDSYSDENIIDVIEVIKNSILDIDDNYCAEQLADLLITFFREAIMKRRNAMVYKRILEFAMRDLFEIYIKNKSAYYQIVKVFYKSYLCKNPNLSRELFEDAEKIANGKPDNGYMNIDYLYIAYHLASYGLNGLKDILISEDISFCERIITKYKVFCEFANRQYGYKSYNLPKANKLIKEGMKKTNCITYCGVEYKSFWPALSYAASVATAQYIQKKAVLKDLGLETYCGQPSPREESIIKKIKKKRMQKLAVLAIVAFGVKIMVSWLSMDEGAAGGLALILIAIMMFVLDDGKPNLFFIGYHYSGSPYWFNW